ncbi:MAG TPA: dihydrolipoamide acetyltransferase family protein [Ilumatobacteraceae bacterium]|nr:dihydrolipoamide acetyltransferase family protein [Ilumatobacteraceae bacterium]HRB02523.1 dihydrolipoamide acetyltransferase family protein [Ilumatobacteraceae bacterium]
MSIHILRLPDVGEGIAEAELVAWHVAAGDTVTSDTVVAEVLTDKATVEIYAPVAGTVTTLHGEPGDVLAIGSDFIAIETGEDAVRVDSETAAPTVPPPAAPVASTSGALASPAVRERANELGVRLGDIRGSGPEGRVTQDDLDRHIGSAGSPKPVTEPTRIPIIGLRRKIADRLTVASSRIPHITYVDEVDMTQLEEARRSLTAAYPEQPRLTVLPFVMRAIVLAVVDHAQVNATFDDDEQVLTTYGAVHIGIATQTPNGLIVPVVRDAQSMDLWQTAAELSRVTGAARDGTATRDQLSGSTITITSLGALGGLVTTPIINHPEVAIIGVNKMQVRPMWDGTTFVPRTMMNLSSSFDHRIVDGWDAATFVQRIKSLLEQPALLLVPGPR